MITALGKRTQQGDLYPPWPAQQDSGSESGSGSLLRGSQHQGSSSGSNYASGTHPGIQQGGNSHHDSPARYDSSGSGSDSDSRLTWWSEASQHQGSSSAPNYASGSPPGIQQEDHLYHSLAQHGSPSNSESEWSWLLKDSQHQGSSSGSNYASTSGTHPGIQQGGNSYHHSPAHYHSSGSDSDSGTSTEVPEASSSKAKSVTWGPTKMIPLSPPPELSLPLPPQAGTAAQKSSSKGFLNKLLKLKFRPRFWRRISGNADGGAVLTLARVGGYG